jgi:hypothetical protein
MAVNRTVLANGVIEPQHGVGYETDLDANWTLLDAWMGGRMMGDLGLNGVCSGFTLSTSATLTPGLTAGVLYAQGRRIALASPAPGAAPANSTSYLFYNATIGFYYQASAVGATAGDALIGQVVTNGSAVTAITQGTPLFGQVSVAPAAGGNFTAQHFLGRAPLMATVLLTSPAAISWQDPMWDGTNLYLVASAAGTGKVILW